MFSTNTKRQIPYGNPTDDGDGGYWWYSSTAVAVKWSIIAAIVLIFVLWFVGGYLHARRRMRIGLPLMAYHRFLVPRHQRAQFEHQQFGQPQNDISFHQSRSHEQGTGYGMHPYPPPAYNPDCIPPPAYQPPDGGSKIALNQHAHVSLSAGESSIVDQPRRGA